MRLSTRRRLLGHTFKRVAVADLETPRIAETRSPCLSRRRGIGAAHQLCLLVLLAVGLALCAFAPPAAAAAAQTTDGLRVSSSTTFVPDPDLERIDVRATYSLTNQQPDEILGETVRSYFYTKWVVALPANVTDFVATSGGVTLSTTIDAQTNESQDNTNANIVYGSIALPFNLNYQQSVQLDVSYIIPGGQPRAGGAVARVNNSFLSFSVWTAGDPGLTDVTIVIPDGFSMDLQGDLDEFSEVTRDDQSVLEALSIENPPDFFGQVFGRNDNGLLIATAELPDALATVRAWPDDPDWVEFVVAAIEFDVPIIEGLTGLDWPAGDIEVIETVTPYLLGYGGWFNASSGVIEVGEHLERDLILHELGHAWFNDDLIGGRWITEGLAEEFASRTIEATSDERPNPTEPDLADPVRVPLAEWASPWTLSEEDAFAYEQYHYNASWWVIRQITAEIGLDAFSDVLIALDQDEVPYRGEGPVEQTKESTRWTHLFDLLETQAGASGLDQLFTTYVLSPPDIAKLAPRSVTRSNYDELVAASADWSPPLIVRREMTGWHFAVAQDRIDDARNVLARRDAADALAAQLGVFVDHDAEMTYETAASRADLVRALTLEERLVDDLDTLRDDRDDLVAQAAALNTYVEFEPLDYAAAVADVADQRKAITEVAELRNQVIAAAATLDLTSPDWPQPAGATDFAAEAALAQARLATIAAIDTANTAVAAPRSFTQRVGLWRRDPAANIADARSAFERDALDEALAATGAAETLVANAAAAGRTRLNWIALTIALAALATLFIKWMHSRSPRPTSVPQPASLNQHPSTSVPQPGSLNQRLSTSEIAT